MTGLSISAPASAPGPPVSVTRAGALPALATTTAKSKMDQTLFATTVGQKSHPTYDCHSAACSHVLGSSLGATASPKDGTSGPASTTGLPASSLVEPRTGGNSDPALQAPIVSRSADHSTRIVGE